jgi:hypothetical protein
MDTDSERPSPDSGGPENQRAGGSGPLGARSGDFSQDPVFDPEQLFRVIGHEENVDRVSQAMRAFLARPDMATFEEAVAVFVRSARARGEPVERVLAVLIELAEQREGVALPHDRTPTDLRGMVLRAVLLAFYGDAALAARSPGVERRRGNERRRVDVQSPHDERQEPR